MYNSTHTTQTQDTENLYRFILERSDFLERFPYQFWIVENMPEEFADEDFLGLKEPDGITGLCLVRRSEHMLNNLEDLYLNKRRILSFDVPSIRQYLNAFFDITTRVRPSRIKRIYETALSISHQLDIDTPPILIADIFGVSRTPSITFFNEETQSVLLIVLKLGTAPQMIRYLAHELRHCWQNDHDRALFGDSYKDPFIDGMKAYLRQPVEIDAEAFACLYLQQVGYSSDCISRLKGLSKDPDVLRLISERLKEIEKDYA